MKRLTFLVEIIDDHLSVTEGGDELLYVSMACPSASEALQETIWNRYVEEDERNERTK